MNTRTLILTVHVAVMTIATAIGFAQAPAAPAAQTAFEVASVKPNTSGQVGGQFGGRPGGQLVVRNNTLQDIIRNAYQLQLYQLVGGPDWLARERFDITAKAASDAPSFPEM